MTNLDELSAEIENIKTRNKRVELDKAWETSWTRRIAVLILTYAVIVIFFFAAHLPDPFLNAIVPAAAFVISTLSMTIFEKDMGAYA